MLNKISKILMGLCLTSSLMSPMTVCATGWNVEDEAKSLYSSIKSDFNTMQSNYGKLDDSNMSAGYKSYLNQVQKNDTNLKLKEELLKQELGKYQVDVKNQEIDMSDKVTQIGPGGTNPESNNTFQSLKQQILATQANVSKEKAEAKEQKYKNVIDGWREAKMIATLPLNSNDLNIADAKNQIAKNQKLINSNLKTEASKISDVKKGIKSTKNTVNKIDTTNAVVKVENAIKKNKNNAVNYLIENQDKINEMNKNRY